MDKKLLAWGLTSIALCLSGMICALVAIGGGSQTVSTVGLTLASTGLISAMAMMLYDRHVSRPWRSGSHQYQNLKHATFSQLKNNPDDELRIRQAFYIGAESCGVVQNIYCKDFELMKGAAEECITKKKRG